MAGFKQRMQKRGKNVSVNADRVVRKCALIIDGAVVLATPVDTGRARSNWQVSANSPITTTREPYSPGSQLGKGEGANARAALQQGQQVIANYKGGTPDAAIYIANNLAYIGRLNAGSSKQAPAAFVETAVMQGANAVRGESLVTHTSGVK
jgi:hypothetical protein